MSIKINRLTAECENKVFGLVAGPSSVGKTTQATTFPREETLIVSLEKGTLSIKGSDYAYVEASTYDEVMEVLSNIGEIAPWCKYLYIDSLAEIYDIINKEAKDQFSPKQNFAKFDHVKMRLFHCIRTAKNSPISVFFVCHTKMEKNGMSMEENLAFEGKTPEDIKKQFDLIVHMTFHEDDEGNRHRVFKTSPSVSNVAKRRTSPWLNTVLNDIEEPNLYKLTQKLTGQQ